MRQRFPFNPVSRVLAATLLLSLAFPIPPAHAATKRRAAPAAGPPRGAVMLSTPDPRTPVEHNNRAVELGTKGLWPDAIRHHEEALKADPHNKEFRTNLSAAQLRYGEILLNRGDKYNAIKQFRGALYVDPNNQPADAGLDEALRRLKIEPTDYKAREKMAEDANVSGDYETAIVEYRKCVKMRDDGMAHYNLGQVLLKAGKTVDGFNELKIAVGKDWGEHKKELSDCHRQLADILKEYAYIAKNDGRGTVGMKRLLNAGIEYRRAATINSGNMDAVRGLVEVAREAVGISQSYDNYMMLGGAYQLAGDFERAKMAYEDAWKVNPNANSLPIARKSFYLAVCTSAQTPPALLASTLQKIESQLQKDPSDAELWYCYGRGKEAMQDNNAALQAFQRAAAINPHVNPDLQAAIGRAGGAPPALATGTPEGPQAVKPAAKPDETAKNLLAYAEVEKKLSGGELDEAQTLLLQIVEKNPKEGRAWLLLGNTQEKKGNSDEAIVSYRQASYLKEPGAESALRQISSSRVQPMLQEGEQAAKDNNWVKAAASYREALSIAPNLPLVHRKLAEALRQLGDNKEADRELKKATELEKDDK